MAAPNGVTGRKDAMAPSTRSPGLRGQPGRDTHTRLRRRLRSTFLSALLLALVPVPAVAQALTGRAFDAVTGEAVAGVEVAVLTGDGAPVGLAVTDSVGAFHTAIAEAGRYRLVAEAAGYEPVAVDSVAIGAGEDVRVELLLGPRPFDVEGIRVVARRALGRPELRDFYWRLDRHERTGRGLALGREDLEQYRGETASRVLARESIHVQETIGPGVDRVIVKRRVPSITEAPWCVPAFFLDGLPVDGQVIRAIPASDLEGLELYRGPSQVPAAYMGRPGATSCGVILAWTRADAGGALARHPVRFGVYALAAPDAGSDGSLGLGDAGVELELGLARMLVGWVELGVVPYEKPTACPFQPGGDCDDAGVPWNLAGGVSLFPVGPDAWIAPYVGAGLGLGSPGLEVRPAGLWRAGIELVPPGPASVRLEVRSGGHGWGAGIEVMF